MKPEPYDQIMDDRAEEEAQEEENRKKMKFRKKPVIIEAMQYTGNNGNDLEKWSRLIVLEGPILEPTKDNPSGCYIQIRTPAGIRIGIVGDWIIKSIKGEFYPCKPDIFEQTYEKIIESKE